MGLFLFWWEEIFHVVNPKWLRESESQTCHGQVSSLLTFSLYGKVSLSLFKQTERPHPKKMKLIEQLVPIFHNPNIVLPMRILTVQEVRKLAGL